MPKIRVNYGRSRLEMGKFNLELVEEYIEDLINNNDGIIPRMIEFMGKADYIPKDRGTLNKLYIQKYGISYIDYYKSKGYTYINREGCNGYTLEIMREKALEFGFELLNKAYTSTKENAILKCINCKEIKEIKFHSMLQGVKCNKCKPHTKRLTYNQIKNYIEIESNSGCRLMETEESYYLKCKLQPKMALCKLKIKCKCGNIFERSFNAFKSGGYFTCNQCSIGRNSHTLSYNEVKSYIEKYGCTLLSNEFIGVHENLHIKCSCGNDFYRAFSTFKGTPSRAGVHKCKICTGATIKYTTDEVRKELNEYNITLISDEYMNFSTNMKIKYECGFECERSLYNIRKSKYKCPHCIKKGYQRDTKQLYQEIKEITNGEYELLSEYKTMNDKVKIKHHKCGNIYEITPHNFIDAGNRCAKCQQSKGEIKIATWLKDNCIINKEQYTFEDLVSDYGFNLRFDFCVFDNSNNINYLLEYDGEFHYLPIVGEEALCKQQERDELKNIYCRNNNIKLIRIPYWEFDNVENILNDILINNNENNEFIFIK